MEIVIQQTPDGWEVNHKITHFLPKKFESIDTAYQWVRVKDKEIDIIIRPLKKK